jgi:hypothetical protein
MNNHLIRAFCCIHFKKSQFFEKIDILIGLFHPPFAKKFQISPKKPLFGIGVG